jgi:hopanoid biosynthesis associated RND transporter like protein HpnN
MKPSRAPGRSASRATPHDPGTAAPHGPRIGGLTARVLAWWVDQARRLAWLIVGVATLGAVSGGYYAATHLGMNTDTEAMLSSELPFRKLSMDFDKAFPQLGDNIVIVIDGRSPDQAEDAAIALAAKLRFRTDLFRAVYFPQGDAFFRRNGLLFLSVEELHSLADRLADAEPLLSRLANDMSLRGMFDLLGQAAEEVAKGDARPEPLVPALRMIGDTVEAYLEGRPAKLSWRELMAPEPLQPSDYRQFIAVQPSPDYATLAPAEAAIKTIRQAAAEFSLDEAHGVRVRLTGGVPMREDELASVRESVSLAGVIALTLVSIVVFIGLRSPRLVAGTMATLLIGLVWTAAFAALAIRQLNLVSVTFAVLFIGLAVDFSIQFGLRYKESIDAGEQHAAALRRAATGTGVGVSLAALCAAIGFFSFVPTAYVGLSELGIIAGVGMFIGAFGALTLLPAILTLMPPRPAAHRAQRMGAAAVRAFVQRHARTICVAALVVGLVSLAALPEARFDFDPVNLRDPNTESVQTYMDLARDSGTSPYRINVLAPDVDAAVNLGDRLERLAVVDKTVTVRSFVPKDQGDKLAVIDSMALFLTPILEFSELTEPPTVAERRAATADLREKLNALTTSSNAGPLARPAERLTNLLLCARR